MLLSRTTSFLKRHLYNELGLTQKTPPTLLLKYLEKKSPLSLIDIGAHDGKFAKSVESYCGISQCLLVEPLPHKAAYLRQIFNSQEYTVVESVLSQSSGTVDFEVNAAEATSSMLKIKRPMQELSKLNLGESKIIQCQSQTLDDLVSNHDMKSIDLIKIDVQGSEHLVLSGGEKTLEISKLIWIEVSFKPLYDGSSVFADIYSLLEKSNFRLMELSPGFRGPTGELLQADALFSQL
jgi:FkbM family methyltransferase